MKKNLLLLCSASLMALSLTSCDKEKKVDESVGQSMVEEAVDKTTEKFEEIAKGKLAAFTLDASITQHSKITINGINPEYVEYFPSYVEDTVSASGEAQANFNLENLNKTPADITGTAFYLNGDINLDATTIVNGKEEKVAEVAKATMALKENYATMFTKDGADDEGDYDDYKLDQDDVNELAEYVKQGLEIMQGNTPSVGTGPSMGDLSTAILVAEIMAEANTFFSGKITSDQFLALIDQKLANGQLFTNPITAMYRGTIVAGLDIVQKTNPLDYLEFSKTSDKNNTKLTTSFKYADWKTALDTNYTTVLGTLTKDSIEEKLLTEFKPMLFSVLPTDLTISTTLGLNREGYVSSFSYDLSVKSSLGKDGIMLVLPLISPVRESPCESIDYEISSSGTININISDKAVEVKTLTIPEGAGHNNNVTGNGTNYPNVE